MKRSLGTAMNRGRLGSFLAAFALAACMLARGRGRAPASARSPAVFSVRGAAGAGPARYDRVLDRALRSGIRAHGAGAGARQQRAGPARSGSWARDHRPARAKGFRCGRSSGPSTPSRTRRSLSAATPTSRSPTTCKASPSTGTHSSHRRPARSATWPSTGPRPPARRPAPGHRQGARGRPAGDPRRAHSLGASAAEAYTSWDFDGRPGHRDLAGLVLIDGGLDGRREQPTLAQARAQLRDFETAPRFDPFDQGAPWVYGAASAIAGLYAQEQPQSPLTAGRPRTRRRPLSKPPFASTNETWLGWVRDLLYPSPRSGRRACRARRGRRRSARLGRR